MTIFPADTHVHMCVCILLPAQSPHGHLFAGTLSKWSPLQEEMGPFKFFRETQAPLGFSLARSDQLRLGAP